VNALFSLHSRLAPYKDIMMNWFRHITIGLTVGIFAVFALNASADTASVSTLNANVSERILVNSLKNKPALRYADRKDERKISARQAKSIAQSRYPGAKFINIQNTGNAYRVRLQQKNGRIVDVYVDARSGRVRG
jgi:uncharacterized membrane protein YkoI